MFGLLSPVAFCRRSSHVLCPRRHYVDGWLFMAAVTPDNEPREKHQLARSYPGSLNDLRGTSGHRSSVLRFYYSPSQWLLYLQHQQGAVHFQHFARLFKCLLRTCISPGFPAFGLN